MRKLIPIINLAAKFASVQRTVGYRTGHLENDAEHSYQLALVCWSANEQYKLGLRDELILKFALVHDLVEVYAGDTDALGHAQDIASKKEKEEHALKLLKLNFIEFKDLLETIERYEKKEDVEAQLVYILDKFIPDVNISGAQGTYYQDRKVDIENWKKWLFSKIDYKKLDIKLKLLVDESIREIEINFKHNFYQEST